MPKKQAFIALAASGPPPGVADVSPSRAFGKEYYGEKRL